MNILLIDSHKGIPHADATNLHVRNSRILAKALGATLVASFDGADEIAAQKSWDAIVCVHASGYSDIDYAVIRDNPQARLFFITNEYNLGEPQLIWMALKEGRPYSVIANHPAEASKIVKKYVSDWHIVNLNCLIYATMEQPDDAPLFGAMPRDGRLYYGSYRDNRKPYFAKYFNPRLIVSTSLDNQVKFGNAIGQTGCKYINKLHWNPANLFSFTHSLYIEDVKTHTNYNFLANRFYEAISCGVTPAFDVSCRSTIQKSGYPISNNFIIDGPDDFHNMDYIPTPSEWHNIARHEKEVTIDLIRNIISS